MRYTYSDGKEFCLERIELSKASVGRIHKRLKLDPRMSKPELDIELSKDEQYVINQALNAKHALRKKNKLQSSHHVYFEQ